MPVDPYDIAAALNGNNHLQLFAVGEHSKQVYTCELVTAPPLNWRAGPWAFLGGPTDTLQLAIARNTNGLLELFALQSAGRVWHTKQASAAYDDWGPWTDINAIDWKELIVGANADGRLEVLGLVNGGQIFHLSQDTPGGTWSRTGFLTGTGWKTLTVGRNADGRMEAFAIGPDDKGYHLLQRAANGDWSDSWKPFGWPAWTQIEVASNLDGRLELFILAGGDALHIWQVPPAADPCQPEVDALNGAQARLTAVLDDPDHSPSDFKAAEQAVTSARNALRLCRADPPNADWSRPASLGSRDLKLLHVGRNADGRLELFALGGDSSISHTWMTAANNGWVGRWSNFNVAARLFLVAPDEQGRLVVIYTGTDGLIHLAGQAVPNGEWTLPVFVADPEPKPTVTLSVSKTRIQKGESATLSWTSENAMSLGIDQGIGPVAIPSGSRPVTPPLSVAYTITASARGGTATDTVNITVDQPPPPPPTGFSSVSYFNCSTEALHFWRQDLTTGVWAEVGTPLSPQRDQNGLCPAAGAQPHVVSLPAAREYLIVAVMPSACGGANDPTNGDCRRYITQVLGDPNGRPAPPQTVN